MTEAAAEMDRMTSDAALTLALDEAVNARDAAMALVMDAMLLMSGRSSDKDRGVARTRRATGRPY